jgi:Na+-driven multidrug efflux pump
LKMAKERDLIHGPLASSMAAYALPVALTGILQQLFNAADVAVVGRFVGTEAMAAVGTDSPLVALLINFFTGLTLGATVVIATAIGEGDEERVHRGVHTSLLLSLITGVLAALIGEICSCAYARNDGCAAGSIFHGCSIYADLSGRSAGDCSV